MRLGVCPRIGSAEADSESDCMINVSLLVEAVEFESLPRSAAAVCGR
jgi:hypothetical protein